MHSENLCFRGNIMYILNLESVFMKGYLPCLVKFDYGKGIKIIKVHFRLLVVVLFISRTGLNRVNKLCEMIEICNPNNIDMLNFR